ncbi:lipase family protein [Williamsia phyllosphaerae]|uniref:Lipase n=1 Tax=Williamsia phyllosphaerae TaxID=885042 RepID=A0ABQ1UWS3_9NOCA|nr:lipase family protein [Williamsia phyllosphaerae]GGF28644.1 putative lipase [Williamsia phyllosphaerae]
MTRRRWTVVGVVIVIVIAAVIATIVVATGGDQASDDRAAVPGARIGGDAPGSLVEAEPMTAFSRRLEGAQMKSARVLYRSTSGDTGAATVVSGAVFTPLGAAPQGGWPVVSFGHGTLGINTECGPSTSPTLLGQTPVVASFVKRGYAVAMADYQGLGAPGVHPYSDARTAGLNMIDVVRALRNTFDDVSNRWAAYGGSQGGGAAWAADEQAATRAPDLTLVGAVGIAPAADVAGLVDKAAAGTLTTDQGPVLQAVIESLGRLHPDLRLDDYRRGAAARSWDVLSACAGNDVHDRGAAVASLGRMDFAPATPAAAAKLKAYLTAWALPQRALSAPLYVEYGTEDTYIDPSWTAAAIRRSCALGGSITFRADPGKGHGDIDVTDSLTWLDQRFDGAAPVDDCARA